MIERIKGHLIDDARQAYKFASMWIIGLIGALDLLYGHMPFVQQYMPDNTVAVLAGAALLARLYKQKSVASP